MLLVRFSSFWIYPLGGALLLYLALHWEPERQGREAWFLAAVGLFLWSLLEYFLHRLFHWESGNWRIKELLKKIHLYHHADPRNPDRMLVRPIYSLPISALFFCLIYVTVGSFFSAGCVMAGMWIGFLYYEWVHYRIHVSCTDRGFLGYQRRLHFYHHFVDEKNCFGVTSPIWDWACGTFRVSLDKPN